ncbi:hypothetical protein A6U87_21640 [Rhizobium sp. AC44/96]|uniref:class I SAM-dependent methyltransferase n=1 Tax=unclassified Rhizobium TaxID=2613769 RepID=UPI00080FDA0E|nr:MULTISPECIES: class I SAM-dependent methyltransferase [unclassified Rhizobium]MDM9621223.1 class I SAM-dependent methyltransferase [Rhizobium sp. S96]OCJ17021.1 hypothetical protein A6U87_21640 [Rhizobium sp. AC44/96]
MDIALRKFIFRDLRAIKGYIDPPDALVFLSLLRSQEAAGLNGAVAEIGVYFGRSYFLFRKLCGGGAKIVAIDPFDIPGRENGRGQYEAFIENGRRLGLPVDEELVIKRDSTQVNATDITEKAGKVRFFSIDGGHMLRHVLSDARLAAESLADHGVIAFDDTCNPAWPEVTVGVADFLREQQGRFASFCMTKYKTYVCRQSFHGLYSQAIATSPDLLAFGHVQTEFLGSQVTRLENPMRRRIMHEFLVRSGMGGLSERAYR